MIQFEDKKGDIYQILSFCLGYLKRKILLLLKVFLNDKNLSLKPQLITELAKQQSSCQQYVLLLKQTKQSLFKKDDEILYQRFVYRIKQLIRNYLPHASVSHQLFVFMKKIETYSFKQNYQFQDYILFILQENPPTLQKQLYSELQQLKKNQSLKRSPPRRYQRMSPQQNFGRISSTNRDFKKLSLIISGNLRSQFQTIQYQSTKTNQNQIRPIDIFNKSIKSMTDCLDCDISIIRGVYFNMQKEKQLINFSKTYQQTFIITKNVRQIYQEMLYQNRFVKDTISNYDKNYARYSIRLQKEPDFYRRERKRCQTANGTKRKYNLSILPDQTGENITKKPRAQTKKKFQTLNNYPTEQQKQELYKQIQKRKNTVLKMKSISISANKGHLELCSQAKEQSKKLSLTFGNMKRIMNQNNSRNVAINLKKKYEMFLNNNFTQKLPKQTETIDQDNTIPTQGNHHPRPFSSTISHTQKIQWLQSSPIILRNSPSKHQPNQPQQFDIEVQLSPLLSYSSKAKQTITTQHLEPKHKIVTVRKQVYSKMCSQDKNQLSQTMGKFGKVHQDFDITIKNFMKGGNVNHRNYANLQHKEKKLFETLNPQLTVKTIRKV